MFLLRKVFIVSTSVRNKVDRHIRRNPDIMAREGVINHIVRKTNLRDRDSSIVLTYLQKLAREGVVEMEMSGNMVTTLKLVRHKADPTEFSPAAKKERMFAKGVPSSLPDSMCSEVVVTHVDDCKASSLREPLEVNELPFEALVELCYVTLRRKADEAGILAGVNSAVKYLAKELGCDSARIADANRFLGYLEYRVTESCGGGVYDHMIDLHATLPITADMLRKAEIEQKCSRDSVQKNRVNASETVETVC